MPVNLIVSVLPPTSLIPDSTSRTMQKKVCSDQPTTYKNMKSRASASTVLAYKIYACIAKVGRAEGRGSSRGGGGQQWDLVNINGDIRERMATPLYYRASVASPGIARRASPSYRAVASGLEDHRASCVHKELNLILKVK